MNRIKNAVRIFKNVTAKGRARRKLLRSGTTLKVVENYAKLHRALVGNTGALMLVQFEDGAECQVEFDTEYAAATWISTQCELTPHFVKASGVSRYQVVVLDESIHWVDSIRQKAGGTIYASYLYDSNSHVYCCELTPSYELLHLFSNPLEDDEEGTVADSIRDACAGSPQDGYFHCRAINQLPPERFVHDFGYVLLDEADDIGTSRAKLEEELRDWCNGNCGGLEHPRSVSYPLAA